MNRFIHQLILLFAVFTLREANALTIATGCTNPSSQNKQRIFYVDPQKGSMSNDGSSAKPWRTLTEVIDPKFKLIATQAYPGNYQTSDRKLSDQNPSGPIKPGDTIYLMSGDHGNVRIDGAVNKDFIVVQAAQGQTPTLRSLRVNGSSKWAFIGLKVQGAGDGSTDSAPGAGLVDFGRDLWRGPTSDVIFADGSVSTADNVSSWTDQDWVKKPFATGLLSAAACITISGNHFFNLRNALGVDGERTLILGNRFNNFGNDAINIVTGNVTISKNVIENGRHNLSEPLHADGIQGWSKPGATNKNVVIDGNLIIKTGDPELSYMQGISFFDGRWEGLTISNNVVVTNHWHGIAAYGVENAKIINNTVVASAPEKRPTWITIQNAKDGRPSKNVIVRNNITTQLNYVGPDVVVDHNVVAKSIGRSVAGISTTLTAPGTHGDGNVIYPNIYSTLKTVDNLKGVYDLRPKANSPAIGAGSFDLAPPTDILGKRRTRPVDVGAYTH